jgi:hypothetical protein
MAKNKRALKSEKERLLADEQWRRYVRARDAGHTEYVDMAKKCDAFYRGEQWNQSDVAKLNAEGRPTLTINTVLSTVNTVLGEQANKRGDVRFLPKRDATQDIAEILNKLFIQIGDNNQLDWLESQVFADGIIQERGYFDVRVDFSDHIEGEVRIESKDPLDIIIDPDAKNYDPKTWSEFFESRWLSLEEIEIMYGQEKADRLRNIGVNGQRYSHDSMEIRDNRFGETMDGYGYEASPDPGEKASVKSIRVIERQYRKNTMTSFFVDNETGDMRMVPDNWSDQRAKLLAGQANLSIVKKQAPRVRWTVTADKVVLHDDWSIYNDFTIVPFFPYFRRGRPFGIVRNLISPQEQLNKISSQELHIVNTTANSGWVVEGGSLSNMTEDELEERGAETGLIITYNRGSTPPTKIQPNQIPTGLDRIGMKAANNIKEISGVSDSLMGFDSAEVSGVAIQAKQARGQVQIQVPLDNLSRTRHIMALKVLDLLQSFYTEQRVIQITDFQNPDQPRSPMTINEETATGEVVNNITLGEYDVAITTAPSRDTFNDSQFAEAISLRTAGVQVPDDAIIEFSHLAQKDELAKRVREMMGQGEPTEEEMQMQQMVQQLEIKQLQATVGNLEADIMHKQTQAQLNQAKAQDIIIDDQFDVQKLQADMASNRESLMLDVQKMQLDLVAKREELMTKLEIAKISARSHTQHNTH